LGTKRAKGHGVTLRFFEPAQQGSQPTGADIASGQGSCQGSSKLPQRFCVIPLGQIGPAQAQQWLNSREPGVLLQMDSLLKIIDGLLPRAPAKRKETASDSEIRHILSSEPNLLAEFEGPFREIFGL
jgi:hypothetical protein